MSALANILSVIWLAILLTIAFVALKVVGVISWPWLWALSPVWILVSAIIVFFVLFVVVTTLMERAEQRRREQMTPDQRAAEACRNLAVRLRRQR